MAIWYRTYSVILDPMGYRIHLDVDDQRCQVLKPVPVHRPRRGSAVGLGQLLKGVVIWAVYGNRQSFGFGFEPRVLTRATDHCWSSRTCSSKATDFTISSVTIGVPGICTL